MKEAQTIYILGQGVYWQLKHGVLRLKEIKVLFPNHFSGESVINFATPSSFLMPFQRCKISQILQTCRCDILW